MKFTDVRQRLIRCLLAGDFQHEFREVVEGKNLLDTGEVSPADVVELLQRCRGDQYQTAPRRSVPEITVHIFLPIRSNEQWYIKAYFIPDAWEDATPESEPAVFISVHRSVHTYRGRRR